MPSIGWVSGTPPQVVPAQEYSGTQAYKAGDAVQFTGGQLAIGASQAIDGIARRDATGTTNSVTEVELINLDSVYCVTYNTTTAQNIIGTVVDMDTATAGAQIFHAGGTTDAVIVALDPRDAVGTSGGRILVKFLAGVTKQA